MCLSVNGMLNMFSVIILLFTYKIGKKMKDIPEQGQKYQA
jgi:hypothetical protein